jgi:hypothetical protein
MPHTEVALAHGSRNTNITVRMRPALVSWALLLLALAPLTAARLPLEKALAGAIVLAGVYAVILAFFWYEASHQRRVLRDIFQAQDASSSQT